MARKEVIKLIECPGCNNEVERLVLHHYKDGRGRLCTWRICDLCNSVLNPHELCSTKKGMRSMLRDYYSLCCVGKSHDELMAEQIERWKERHERNRRVRDWLKTRSDALTIEEVFNHHLETGTELLRRLSPYSGCLSGDPTTTQLTRLASTLLLEESLALKEGDPTFEEISQYFVRKRHQKEYNSLPEVKEQRSAYQRARNARNRDIRNYLREHPEEAERIKKVHSEELVGLSA